MTLADFGTIAEIVSAIAVVVTLAYLSIQLRHANKTAHAQTRERMVEHGTGELYVLMNDQQLRECFAKRDPLTREEQGKLHFFLTSAMREREWEWFQAREELIKADARQAYQSVIAIHLGTERTRRWWHTVGRLGFHPEFVAEVDQFIDGREPITWFADVLEWDNPPAKPRG